MKSCVQRIDRSSFWRNAILPRSFVKIKAAVPASYLFYWEERRSFFRSFSRLFEVRFKYLLGWIIFIEVDLYWHMTWFSRKTGVFYNIWKNSDNFFYFVEILWIFHLILNWKERKRNEIVPFCVPLILEASFPASFLSDFRGTVPASFLKNRNAFRNMFLWTAFL